MKLPNYLKVAPLTVILGCLGGCADESGLLKDPSTEKAALASDEAVAEVQDEIKDKNLTVMSGIVYTETIGL